MDVFLAQILAVCSDTVQEHAGVPANAVVVWETSAAASIQKFIRLVEGAWVLPTSTMENQLASYLLHHRCQDTHRANGGAYGNKCIGDSDKIIKYAMQPQLLHTPFPSMVCSEVSSTIASIWVLENDVCSIGATGSPLLHRRIPQSASQTARKVFDLQQRDFKLIF
jgi:hypothetical protein